MAKRSRSIVTPVAPPKTGRGLRWVTKLSQPKFRPLRVPSVKPAGLPNLLGRDPFILHRRGARDSYGPDVLELRAASTSSVFGSIGERIMYRALTERGLRDGLDFEFQSQLLGGRLEAGGIVADFLFRPRMLVVRIQSLRWHYNSSELIQRDDDQKQILEHMGFVVLDLWENIIFDAMEMENWLRRNIDLLPTTGPFVFVGIDLIDMAIVEELKDQIHGLQARTQELEDAISSILGYPPTNQLVVATANIDTAAITNANVNDLSADKITSGSIAVDEYIQSTGFSAGTTGFKIEGGGDAEFGNITARGQLQTVGVVQGTQSAYGGELVVASGVAILIADVAVGDESIDVKTNDLRSLDNLQFQPTAARVEWMRVREAGTPITGGFRFPVDRAIAGTEQVFTAGEIGVAKGRALDKKQRSSNWGEGREGATAKWGNLGTGWGIHGVVGYHADTFPRLGNTVSADEVYSDSFVGIDRRDSVDPDDGLTAYARIGSLAGFLDYSATPAPTSQVTGFAVGDSTSNYISWDSTNGLTLTNKTSGVIADDTGFIARDQASGTSNYIRWQNIAGTEKARLYMLTDDSLYMTTDADEAFVVGTYESSTWKNWIRIGAAEAQAQNGMAITFYDEDDHTYAIADATAMIWTGADEETADLNLGAKEDVWFRSDIHTDGAASSIFLGGFNRDGAFYIRNSTDAPTVNSEFAAIYVDSADGDLKIKFGDDDTVKTITTDS